MADNQQYSDDSNFLYDLGVKLRDIEEKQNIIKDRVLLIGENLLSEKQEVDSEIQELKSKIISMEDNIKKLRLAMERLIEDNNNFIRKSEFEILQRQFQMFQPLELARISDVENMIKHALSIQGKANN